MFLISSLSFLSLCIKECRCLVSLSGNLATIVAILCFALGVALACMQRNVLDYIDENSEEWSFSQSEIDFFSRWYTVMNITLFIVSFLEFLRHYISIKYRVNSYRIEGEFNALIQEEESSYEEKHEQRKAEIRSKYQNLRYAIYVKIIIFFHVLTYDDFNIFYQTTI